MNFQRAPKECCIPGCDAVSLSFGRCPVHYRAFRRDQPEEHTRLAAMTPEERDAEFERAKHPPIAHFEYTNDAGEAELAAAVEKQERVKSEQFLKQLLAPWTNDEIVDGLLRRISKMSENFPIKDTPALTKIVTETLDGTHGSFEAMKAALSASLGLPSRAEETANYGRPDPAPQAPPLSEQSAGPQNCIRVVYPAGNNRFEIYGSSEEDLDRQEAALRTLFGSQQ